MEQEMMATVIEKLKEGVVRTQVAAGREFKVSHTLQYDTAWRSHDIVWILYDSHMTLMKASQGLGVLVT